MIAKSEKWRYDGKCGCSVYEVCPRCIGIYEQGKSDGRKQAYEEMLKVVKKENILHFFI